VSNNAGEGTPQSAYPETPYTQKATGLPGERMLWSGRPPSRLILHAHDAFAIPFSVFWLGFAIFWEVAALDTAGDSAFPLFGIPFLAIGFYSLGGRPIADSEQRAKTYYGVTDQRAIVLTRLFGTRVKSLSLRTLTDLSMDEKANGTGNITFGQTSIPAFMSWGMWWPGMGQPIRFGGIPDSAPGLCARAAGPKRRIRTAVGQSGITRVPTPALIPCGGPLFQMITSTFSLRGADSVAQRSGPDGLHTEGRRFKSCIAHHHSRSTP